VRSEEVGETQERQLEVRSEELGVTADIENPKSEIAITSKGPSAANSPAPNLLDHVKSMVKEQLKTAPQEVAEDLARDGKSAVNTVIKQAMRRYIKDMF
jgi:hypothetical protein